jgi:hypothetical protein
LRGTTISPGSRSRATMMGNGSEAEEREEYDRTSVMVKLGFPSVVEGEGKTNRHHYQPNILPHNAFNAKKPRPNSR